MITFQSQCKVALFGHQLLDLWIDRMIIRAPYIYGLSSRIFGLSLVSKTCQGLSRKLADRPPGHVGRAIAVKGGSRFVRTQSNKLPINFDGVVQQRAHSNSPVRVRGTLARAGHQCGNIDTTLEIRNTCRDLRNHGASVTVGDEHVRALIDGQRRHGRGVLGETRRWIGTVPRTRQVNGFPRDASTIEFCGDVAPAPRAAPCAVYEDVRRRSHGAIFLDQGSECQTLECLDGAAF